MVNSGTKIIIFVLLGLSQRCLASNVQPTKKGNIKTVMCFDMLKDANYSVLTSQKNR